MAGLSLFDFLDTTTTNFMLPLCAFLICIYVGWVLPKGFIDKELTNGGDFETRTLPVLKLLIRYESPVLILLIFVAKLVDLLG